MKKFLYFLLFRIIDNFDVEIVKTNNIIIFRVFFINTLIYEKTINLIENTPYLTIEKFNKNVNV